MKSAKAGVAALQDGLRDALGGNEGVERARAASLFRGRLSPPLAQRLVQVGVRAPEQLLFMTPAAMERLPGLSDAGLAEIAAYRAQYLPDDLLYRLEP